MAQPGSLIFTVLNAFITYIYVLHLVLCELLLSRVYVEANEAPLSLRREKLALQYYTKLIQKSCPSNPAFDCIINPKYQEFFVRKNQLFPISVLKSNLCSETVISLITMYIKQLYLRSRFGLYIVLWLIWNSPICPRRICHLLFLFKNLIKLRTIIPISFRFILIGQKTMTGLDVEQF